VALTATYHVFSDLVISTQYFKVGHHPGGVVLYNMAVIHPATGPVVGNPCDLGF
jgi:hypothetical protein